MTVYDTYCRTCEGKGEVAEDDDENQPCAECEGYGHHLTTEGKRLLDFLARRGFAMPMSPLAEHELGGIE